MGLQGPEEDTMMDEVGGARHRRRRAADDGLRDTPTALAEPIPIIDETTRSLRLVGLEEPDWMDEPELR